MRYGQILLIGWASMAIIMLLFYVIQRRTRNAGIVDFVWAAGVGALAVFYASAAEGNTARNVTLGILAGVWSLRLAFYLLFNRVIGKPEDGRYEMLRNKWGPNAQLNLFFFFQVQAIWAVMFSIPFIPVVYNKTVLGWSDYTGIIVWLIAVIGETIADRQLARFRLDPENQGKTCRIGLWNYSRHPNYFFELIHWFTYVFLGIGSSYWWVTFLGPVLMLLFLYKITGIPYTEKRALLSRGEDYRQYQQTTSSFIPWFPKRGKK
jgi:steroid 5-alpha reductase family enzyme